MTNHYLSMITGDDPQYEMDESMEFPQENYNNPITAKCGNCNNCSGGNCSKCSCNKCGGKCSSSKVKK